MRNKLLIFGLLCMLAGGLLSVVINRAKAQVETCPNGYYLATNNLCYPYQLQQTQTPAANSSSSPDQVLTKYASTPDGFSDGNVSSIQIAFSTVKKVSLGSSGNQYQMEGTLKNTSGHDITSLDINAMLIDNKAHNVGMVWGIPSSFHLANQQSTSFSGLLNEDSQNAAATAYKMTVG